jgi:hypothetical protein
LFFTLLWVNYSAVAQPYVEGGKTRHRFAQLNLGLDQRMFSKTGSSSALINTNGQIETFELNKASMRALEKNNFQEEMKELKKNIEELIDANEYSENDEDKL